ncbi:MAG: CRISPR-associated endonuclease Cas1 [Gammaproteobacteria bacterium]|nr:MAG: CRISPR-associated endonuclease Cas1 [Gammaproteobacteria bacterium]
MATLYLDRQTAAVEREGASIVVRDRTGRRTNLPLNLLDRIVIRGTVALDTSVLGHLGDAGIVVSILSGRFHRLQGSFTGPLHNDARRRLGQARAYDDPRWCRRWSHRLVRLKLRQQQRLLEAVVEARPDVRLRLRKAIDTLRQARARLADAQGELAAPALLGIEGSAAQAYFAGLAAVVPPAFGFHGRNRRPPKDPFNALLSLGYTLLHSEAVKAIWAAGLDPYLGFYHRPEYGRESLAADLIEPLRPRVDRLCWELVRTQTVTPRHFRRSGQACLLSKSGREHFYQGYEMSIPPARRALRRAAMTLAKRFANHHGLEKSQ